MKAKRIAEIAHKMSQLRAEMDALNAALKDEYGSAYAAQLIAKAVIENTLKATPFAAAAAGSDQLRAELTANNIEMNRLTERNDAILSTLRGRGLEPVRVRDDVKCKVNFKCWDKPLSDEQLRAGDWFCREVSAGVTQLLIDKDISYSINVGPYGNFVKFAVPIKGEPSKEIIRKGNEFYYV